jgi:hypothetical protein
LLLRSIPDAIHLNTALLVGERAMVSLATALIGVAFVLLGLAQLLPVTYDLIANTFA